MTWPGRGLRRLLTASANNDGPTWDYMAGTKYGQAEAPDVTSDRIPRPGPPPMPPGRTPSVSDQDPEERDNPRTLRPCDRFIGGDVTPGCLVCGWPDRDHPANAVLRAEQALARGARAQEIGGAWAADIAAAAAEMEQRTDHGPFGG